jgi:hypothetical protein
MGKTAGQLKRHGEKIGYGTLPKVIGSHLSLHRIYSFILFVPTQYTCFLKKIHISWTYWCILVILVSKAETGE